MKIISTDNKELIIEDSCQDECPNCGDTDTYMYYIPDWCVHRCYGCLMNEVRKYQYIIVEE